MKNIKINFGVYFRLIIISLLISCSNKEKSAEQNKKDSGISGMDMSNAKDTSMTGMDMTETADKSSTKMDGMNMADRKSTNDNSMSGMNMNASADTTLIRFANETYHSIISSWVKRNYSIGNYCIVQIIHYCLYCLLV